MLLTILDETTFMVGGKTHKVGDVLDLAAMTTPVPFPWGDATIVQINEHLKTVSTRLRKTRLDLSTRLHMVEEAYDEEAARLSVEYEDLERDWLYYSDTFYKAIQMHIGGQLPLIRDPETGTITIRAKQPQETLNYLRDVCAQRVMFHNYESVRHLALHFANGHRENVSIESETHIETRIPIVSAEYVQLGPLPENWLHEAVVATYDNVTRYGSVAGIAWTCKLEGSAGRVYFLNAGALLRAGQGDPKLALTTAIERCKTVLPKPFEMSFFIYGNMPIADENARGVLISVISGDKARYEVLTVSKDQKLSVAEEGDDTTNPLVVSQEGEEAKLDTTIIELAKLVMAVPEEDKPKEE